MSLKASVPFEKVLEIERSEISVSAFGARIFSASAGAVDRAASGVGARNVFL
jgi:hypothetical protein